MAALARLSRQVCRSGPAFSDSTADRRDAAHWSGKRPRPLTRGPPYWRFDAGVLSKGLAQWLQLLDGQVWFLGGRELDGRSPNCGARWRHFDPGSQGDMHYGSRDRAEVSLLLHSQAGGPAMRAASSTLRPPGESRSQRRSTERDDLTHDERVERGRQARTLTRRSSLRPSSRRPARGIRSGCCWSRRRAGCRSWCPSDMVACSRRRSRTTAARRCR